MIDHRQNTSHVCKIIYLKNTVQSLPNLFKCSCGSVTASLWGHLIFSSHRDREGDLLKSLVVCHCLLSTIHKAKSMHKIIFFKSWTQSQYCPSSGDWHCLDFNLTNIISKKIKESSCQKPQCHRV